MDRAFIAAGHGYSSGSRGRCEAFDGFEVLANPLGGFGEADRASRSFPGDRPGGPGVTYGSHSISLARRPASASGYQDRDLYLLMHHGAGREVWRVPAFYDGDAMLRAVLAMPEREQYALLYSMWQLARNARVEAEAQTRAEWAQAHDSKRIRRRRGGPAGWTALYIESREEAAWRKRVA